MTKISSVLRQRYSGDITLLPVDSMLRFWTILENPTTDSMEQSTLRGERATWPVLSMIKTHMDVELLIDNALRRVSEYVSFSESTSDLRRMQLRHTKVQNHGSGGRLRTRRTVRSRTGSTSWRGRSTDRLRIRLVPSDFQMAPPMKVSGEEPSESALSSSESSSDESDDELDVENVLIMAPQAENGVKPTAISTLEALSIQTQPNTPLMERKRWSFGTSRSGSPGPAPMSLTMTPVTPRASSPETTYKNGFRHHHRSRTSLTSPSSSTALMSDGRVDRPWHSRFISIQLPKRVKSSIGIVNATEPASKKGT